MILRDFCGGKEVFVVKVVDNGDCLYNVTFIVFCGDELFVLLLRFFVFGELFFNVKYYAEYLVFSDAFGDIGIFVNILFLIVFNR